MVYCKFGHTAEDSQFRVMTIENEDNRNLRIFEEDDFLLKYLLCTVCLFLWHARKHQVCSGKQSAIVLCYIFRSSCSLNQYGEWNVTMVLYIRFHRQ